MPWFIKRETLRCSGAEMRQTIAEHHDWVHRLRAEGVSISSGYLVDGQGTPGGGGLLLLQASDYRSAEALILQDPMVRSGQVDWQLHQWVAAVGQLNAT